MHPSASVPPAGGRATQTKVPLQQVFSQISSSGAQRSHPYLSQVGNRVRAQDADAMAEYMKRSRSGSSSSTAAIGTTSLGYPTANSVAAAQASATTNQSRVLRPSMSAASLRVMPTLSSSPPEQVVPVAQSPEKSAARKLISSKSRRPGTADAVSNATSRNPFNLLTRHAHESTNHDRAASTSSQL